ncbi:hypothetical protein ISS04_04730, partial [Candidatus Woesearchaeota archaeon]|nr:hypothetical protein [Candidatus Woesearchaeota archaeon]
MKGKKSSGDEVKMEENKPEDLIKKINEALSHDGEDVSFKSKQAENMQFISINRRPSGEPVWYTAEDGSTVVDWKEKFDRQENGKHPPFGFGDKVYVSGLVEYDSDGLYKFHVDADGRIADNFYIATVSSPDPLEDHVGMPLEAIVDVIDERKSEWQISNIQNYDARLVEVVSKPFVNPTENEIEDLDVGKRVVIKGRFSSFGESGEDRFLSRLGYPKGSRIAGLSASGREATLTIDLPDCSKVEKTVHYPPEDYHDNSTFGIVETDDGRNIRINMPTGRVSFSGGVLECLTKGSTSANQRKSPEHGDYVRIGAFVNKNKGLSVHWCDPCVLDKPS